MWKSVKEWWKERCELAHRRAMVAGFHAQPHLFCFEDWEAEKLIFGDCRAYPKYD